MDKKAGPVLECTVKTQGYCCGGRCALHGACPHEKAILLESKEL